MNNNQLGLHPIFSLSRFDDIKELNKTAYAITDLLPQNNSALVLNSKIAAEILKKVYNISRLLVDCLDKFYIYKQYQYFDPHVGESSCQIRAYAFVRLSKKNIVKDSNVTVIERIHFLNGTLDKLRKTLNSQIDDRSHKKKRHTIVEFLKEYGFYFFMEWQECFLYASYCLTLFKRLDVKKVYICDNEIARFFTISKAASKKMIYKYQSQLARMSCEFIGAIALDLNIDKKNTPSLISAALFDDDGRMIYPFFFFQGCFLCICKKQNVQS